MHKPKFLLDADMPRSSAVAIRSLDFDVEDVRDLGILIITPRGPRPLIMPGLHLPPFKDMPSSRTQECESVPGVLLTCLQYGASG
jgi:hypothetical protein